MRARVDREVFLPTWTELGWPGGERRLPGRRRAGAGVGCWSCPSARGGACRDNGWLVRGCRGCESPGTSPAGALASITIEASSINGLTLDQGSYDLHLGGSVLSGLEARAATLLIGGTRSQFLSSKIEGGKIVFSGELAVASVQFRDVNIKIGIATRMRLQDCTFHGTVILLGEKDYAQDSFSLSNCTFWDCGIFGMRLPRDSWESYIDKNLDGCRGVVVVDDDKQEMVQRKKFLAVSKRTWMDDSSRRELLDKNSFLLSRKWLSEMAKL
jgi:hypothetical protein